MRGRLTGKMKQNYNNGLELLCTFVEIYLKTGLSESLFGFSPAAGLNWASLANLSTGNYVRKAKITFPVKSGTAVDTQSKTQRKPTWQQLYRCQLHYLVLSNSSPCLTENSLHNTLISHPTNLMILNGTESSSMWYTCINIGHIWFNLPIHWHIYIHIKWSLLLGISKRNLSPDFTERGFIETI